MLPAAPAGSISGLPAERKVAQLFLFGFRGTDLNAEIFERLRRQDLGGVVIGRDNYTTSDALGQMAGEARVIARRRGPRAPVRDGQPARGRAQLVPRPPAGRQPRGAALGRRGGHGRRRSRPAPCPISG